MAKGKKPDALHADIVEGAPARGPRPPSWLPGAGHVVACLAWAERTCGGRRSRPRPQLARANSAGGSNALAGPAPPRRSPRPPFPRLCGAENGTLKPFHRVSPTAVVAVAYVTGIFMAAVDLQIVNVALPTLGRVFHASIATAQWAVLGYVLSLAVLIPASAWIGDRLGNKRTFLLALGIFTLASAL